MADQGGPGIDERGIIKTGRFAGQHVANLAQYAEDLEKEVRPGTKQQAEQPEQTPQEHLAQHAGFHARPCAGLRHLGHAGTTATCPSRWRAMASPSATLPSLRRCPTTGAQTACTSSGST